MPEVRVLRNQKSIGLLKAYPNGMQIGGADVTAINADDYIRAIATHVIVTSFFKPEEYYGKLGICKS